MWLSMESAVALDGQGRNIVKAINKVATAVVNLLRIESLPDTAN